MLPQPCTYTAGAGSAELGKEALAPERTAGTPIPGTVEETTDATTEEQGGIPIPTASLLQVTERRRECSPCTRCLPLCPLLPLRSLPTPSQSLSPPPSPQPLVPPSITTQPLRSHGAPTSAPGALSGSCPPAVLLPTEPLSSVSSLEVHFDLLDLTELTDMSDQELAEVFADSDEENVASESPSGE